MRGGGDGDGSEDGHGHIGGVDGNFAAGNVLELLAQVVGDLFAAAIPLAFIHQGQADRGRFRLGWY